MSRPALTPEQISDLKQLLADGIPRDQIADAFGISASAVTYHAIRAGYATRGQGFTPTRLDADTTPLRLIDDIPRFEGAVCAQTDPEAFFPEKGGSTREAKAVCRECPVQTQCLDWALDHDERFGIWGGLSERERRKIKRRTAQPQLKPGRHLSGLTCALEGCAEPTTRGDTGRPLKYCTPEHQCIADAQPNTTPERRKPA